jgi:hypothetical protein
MTTTASLELPRSVARNRRLGFSQLKEPGLRGGVLPAA